MSMLQKYREETENAIAALRSAAQARFQDVVEEPSRHVSEEFESVMQSLEEKRRQNAERVARIREQTSIVQSQLDGLRRMQSAQEALQRSSLSSSRGAPSAHAVQELGRLKHSVRISWRHLENSSGALPLEEAAQKITFLSRCLKYAPFSAKLYGALLAHARSLRSSADRKGADAAAVEAARRQYRETAARMAQAASQLHASSGGSRRNY
jgi:hypothetical protein